MNYIVSIAYNAPTPGIVGLASPIFATYAPTNSYVDTAAYDGTVYDTNVKGFGSIAAAEPFASTSFPYPVPMAQFKVAATGSLVSFIVDDYKEAFYYEETGKALAAQGFSVAVISEGDFASVTAAALGTATVAHGTPLTLTATITPANASIDGEVSWILSDAGTTGATLNGNILTTTASGTAKVKAVVKNAVYSSGVLSDFTSSDLSITVS